MKKVEFKIYDGFGGVQASSSKYYLLSYYISEFTGDIELNEEITELKKILLLYCRSACEVVE